MSSSRPNSLEQPQTVNAKPTIIDAVSNLDHALEEISRELTVLEDRLIPVLLTIPEGDGKGEVEPTPPTSELHSELIRLRYRLKNVCHRIAFITNRVDI